ncbi:MAG TPA: tyrosine-type recombinase/integrase [Anaerolineae bacterium]|nr:tyrosine-type recombinase/integrase [Anaerolineae bacterium]
MVTHQLTLSQTIANFIHYKEAVGRSEHTIADYRNTQKKLLEFFADDPSFATITRTQLINFFAWLTKEYVSDPDGVAPRGKKPLSPKTIFNIHTNCASLWAWACDEEIVERNLMRTIEPPDYEPPVIVEFTRDEIAALLKACDVTRHWRTRNTIASHRPTADQDRAIILTLIDTGIRAEELCNLTMADLNMGMNALTVRGKGAGRDKKERLVYFGKTCGKALYKYLMPRLGQPSKDNSALFLNSKAVVDRPLNRDSLYRLLQEISTRAGVKDVHPHRFRHSFAITYLRNGGDVFTLQQMLGHSDIEMVKRYAQIAQSDCANVHRKASPADNWRL